MRSGGNGMALRLKWLGQTVRTVCPNGFKRMGRDFWRDKVTIKVGYSQELFSITSLKMLKGNGNECPCELFLGVRLSGNRRDEKNF